MLLCDAVTTSLFALQGYNLHAAELRRSNRKGCFHLFQQQLLRTGHLPTEKDVKPRRDDV